MLFNSLEFLFFFLPVVFAAFFLLSRVPAVGQRLAATWLAAASLFFYGWWSPVFVPLLCASVLFNFVLGRIQAQRPKRSSALLVVALVGNLGLLFVYKYATLLSGTLAAATGLDLHIRQMELPLGISFYTFTQIAFQVDVHKGKAQEYDFVYYLLFVTYFPHLIAGPILHHRQMMPQFSSKRTYVMNPDSIAAGLSIFTIGLAKKVLLADRLADYAAPVFTAAGSGFVPALFSAWAGILAFTFQIYYDFSGYSDMAIGLSLLFGIMLPINFNSPYMASNIIDFWRRWHISLSAFLKEYLYIPLGGNRLGSVRRYANLMTVMLLGGLWHGANWTFAVWGGLHGLYLCMNHLWRRLLGADPQQPSTLPGRIAGRLVTFLSVSVAWVFFRADSFGSAWAVLRGMCGAGGISLPLSMRRAYEAVFSLPAPGWLVFEGALQDNLALARLGAPRLALLLAVAMSIAWLLPNSQRAVGVGGAGEGTDGVVGLRWRASKGWAVAMGIVLAACVSDMQHVTEFLYFQF